MCINYHISYVCGHKDIVQQKCEFGEVKWRGRAFPCINEDINTRENRECIKCSPDPKVEGNLTDDEIKCLLPDEQERLKAGDDYLKVIIRTEKYLKRNSFHTWFKTFPNPVFATSNEIETQILRNKALLVEREKARLRRNPNKTLPELRWLHQLEIDHVECLRNLDAQKSKNEQEAAEKRANSQTTESSESGEAESSDPTTTEPEDESANSQANNVNASILALNNERTKKGGKGKEREIALPTWSANSKSTEAVLERLSQDMPDVDQNEDLDLFRDNGSHVLQNHESKSSNPESQLPAAETHPAWREYQLEEFGADCKSQPIPIVSRNVSSRVPSRRENNPFEKVVFGVESTRSGELRPEFDDDEIDDWPERNKIERPKSRFGFRPVEQFEDEDEEQFTVRLTTTSNREDDTHEDNSVQPQCGGSKSGPLSTTPLGQGELVETGPTPRPLPIPPERPSPQHSWVPQRISAYSTPGKAAISEIRKYLSMPESMAPFEMLHWWWRNRNVAESFLRGVQPFINESAAKTMFRASRDRLKANEFCLSLMGTIDWQEVSNSPVSVWEDDSDDEREIDAVEELESDNSTVFVYTVINPRPNDDKDRQKLVGGSRLWTKSPSRLRSVTSIVKTHNLRPGETPLLLTDFDSADSEIVLSVSSFSEVAEAEQKLFPLPPIHEEEDDLYSYKSSKGAELLSTVVKHMELPLETTPSQISKWLDENESVLVRHIRDGLVHLPLTPSNENALTNSEDARNELIFAMQHIDWLEIDMESLDLQGPLVRVNIEEMYQAWHNQPEKQGEEFDQKMTEETFELSTQKKKFEEDDGNQSDESQESDDSVEIITTKTPEQIFAKKPALSASLSPKAPSFTPRLLRASAPTFQPAPPRPQISSFIPARLRPQPLSFVPASPQTSTMPQNLELGLCFRCKKRGHKFRNCLKQ